MLDIVCVQGRHVLIAVVNGRSMIVRPTVYMHALDPQRLSDMALMVDSMKDSNYGTLGFRNILSNAWKKFSQPVMRHTLERLPNRRSLKRPPCYTTGGLCICGENAVILDLRVCFKLYSLCDQV